MSSNEPSKKPSEEQDASDHPTRRDVSLNTRSAQTAPNYGSISSFQSSTGPSQAGQDTTDRASQRSLPRLTESPIARSEPPQSPMPAQSPMTAQSPLPPSRPRKPSTTRRPSSKRQLPQRGQEFSCDDDPAELQADQQPPTPPSTNPPPLRRQDTLTRRRTAAQVTPLPRVDSEEEVRDLAFQKVRSRDLFLEAVDDGARAVDRDADGQGDQDGGGEAEEEEEEEEDEQEEGEDSDDDGDLSDAESFTLKDRQSAINQTHPFGIRIWKPALYKKNRSVEKTAEEDIHSSPSASVSNWLWLFNALWTLLFGWWLAIACLVGALVCAIVIIDPSAREYSRVFWGLARYLFYPFGQFVKLESDENYAEEDEGEGRSISEYERWQIGDLEHGRLFFGPHATGSIVGRRRNSMDSASENDSLLGRSRRQDEPDPRASKNKRRIFGRGRWTVGRVVFYGAFYILVAPLMFLAAAVCWMMVFWIPMARVSLLLFQHLRKHPLALSFHPDATYSRDSTAPSAILLCTYRAVGSKYWKYTVDGTNVFLINLLAVVAFVIVDYFFLAQVLHVKMWLTGPALLFSLSLLSVVPLAYFIGQAVASISAQSSMGMGAAVNAFFSTIVEVYLYCIALNEGKGRLVEGSVIGSIFAGILFLPGLSMCFGAIRRKTQRFNVKSAGATSTLLLFAVIAAFGPTLFYKIYGSHELICYACASTDEGGGEADRDCRRCYFRQIPAVNDAFFVDAVRPYCWFAAVMLFFSYVIGLLFTLRTHAAVIWTIEPEEKKPISAPTAEVSPTETRQVSAMNGAHSLIPIPSPFPATSIHDSALYKSILGQSLKQVGIKEHMSNHRARSLSQSQELDPATTHPSAAPHLVPPPPPPKSQSGDRGHANIPGMSALSASEQHQLATYVAQVAATAATVAARDATKPTRRASLSTSLAHQSGKTSRPHSVRQHQPVETHRPPPEAEAAGHASGDAGGHDAPNWSRTKSAVVLCAATVAYALVAEVLVNTVDVVLESADIDEKFLGITLFALVPNTTEFLNAISFAMNGNIALSMEIGSAYALQVCLLQIPALVLFSALQGSWAGTEDALSHTFSLIFPQFDMVTVIMCVFLLSYMYGEGKSNYFKGGILILTYLVVILGFYYSGYTRFDLLGVDPGDTLAIMSSPRMSAMGGRPGHHREL